MAEIARITLDFEGDLALAWDRIAEQSGAWLRACGVVARDAVVLVPLAQHLVPARRAFGRLGPWLPRIETVRTLAAATAPVQRPDGALSFDTAQDRLRARQLLRGQAWARQWAERDARAFEHTIASLVDCAQRLAQRAAAIAPAQRPAWEEQARALLAASDGPGGTERLLARVAFEWVCASAPWNTDNLFLLRPGAWIALQAGGENAFVEALLGAACVATPCLALQADPPAGMDPLAAVPASKGLAQTVCDDFEDEAERTAAHLLNLLSRGERPLALIAQDRLLVRRVGALLARQQVPVLDETGWKLSTTRAAAGVMALLRAAQPSASTDELLDWLKAVPSAPTVDALERAIRQHACTRRQALQHLALEGPAREAWHWAQERLAPLGEGRVPLAQWMERLAGVLRDSGQWNALEADAAGAQVLQALRLEAGAGAWGALGGAVLRWSEWVQLVDELLEQAVFEPPPPPQAPAVVITPLRRAVLRPFAAAVLPAADDRHLGAPVAPDPLLGEALSVALGLPSSAAQQRDEAVALAQLLRVPQVLLSCRRHDEGELREPSPLVERLLLLHERAGVPVRCMPDPRRPMPVTPMPLRRPAPRAAGRLPTALSASAVEALRDCPYRFFSRSVLGLKEAQELDDEAEKRDYGNWLHAVLWRFHQQRPGPRSVEADLRALRETGEAERAEAGLDDASFLPFEATFERFAQHYAEWLQTWDAQGAQWLEGEAERQARAEALEDTVLRGRIDRIDRRGGVQHLLDYKTVPYDSLRKRVRDPLEDTQLAFYAALQLLQPDGAGAGLEAAYLALDDAEGVRTVQHPDVTRSARVLLQSLGQELRRMRAGEPLPALGDGAVCEHCEARGLCRRDHWSVDPQGQP
ncbi:MAG: PD-(D/E)XK nuclease family protein [Pseudomonadota bacterium]